MGRHVALIETGEMCVKFSLRSLEGGDRSADIGVVGMILKCILGVGVGGYCMESRG